MPTHTLRLPVSPVVRGQLATATVVAGTGVLLSPAERSTENYSCWSRMVQFQTAQAPAGLLLRQSNSSGSEQLEFQLRGRSQAPPFCSLTLSAAAATTVSCQTAKAFVWSPVCIKQLAEWVAAASCRSCWLDTQRASVPGQLHLLQPQARSAWCMQLNPQQLRIVRLTACCSAGVVAAGVS